MGKNQLYVWSRNEASNNRKYSKITDRQTPAAVTYVRTGSIHCGRLPSATQHDYTNFGNAFSAPGTLLPTP
jgi:hypothetical protein